MKYLCHQRPDRSFFYKGHQFPLCARCTGLVIGTIFYVTYSFLIPIHYSYHLLLLSIVLHIPYIADGTTQYLGLRESNNTLRFVTGFIGAIGLIIMVRIFKIIIFQLL